MWGYKDTTREKLEARKDFVEKTLVSFGAEPIDYTTITKTTCISEFIYDCIISQRKIYKYNNAFIRVDEVLFPEKPFIVFEYTESYEDVLKNVFEDVNPFPYDLSDEEIIEEVKILLEL